MKAAFGLMLFGALFMVPSLGWSIAKESRISSWTQVRGTVTNLAYYGEQSPVATLEYDDTETIRHKVTTTVPFGTSVGESFDVRYDPDSPSEAVVDEFTSKHFLTIILFPIGLIFSLVGFILWINMRSGQSGNPSGRIG